MSDLSPTTKLLILLALWLVLGGGKGCDLSPSKVTAVTYTLDDKQHTVPPPVAAALNTLNRQKILATVDEVDTTDGTGEVPDQYKVSRPAAVAAGLPALVVMAGDKVRRVVSKPTTDTQVLEAAK